MAWRRFAAAIARGRGADAARWQRIHAALHARVQEEATRDHRDSLNAACEAMRPPEQRSSAWPRLRLTGENVHDVHSKSAGPDEDAGLSRAERRRRLRETLRRS